jgi:signal transduction histidine kinase
MKYGLRLRIAVAFAITCIAVVSALGLTLYTASEELEEELVNQIVSEEVDYLMQRHRADPAYQPPTGPNLQYYILRAPADAAQLPEPLRALPAGNHEVGRGTDERHVAVRESAGTRFVVVYDTGPHEMREQQFKQLLLLALGTVFIAAFVIGYWLAGGLTRQLTELAQRVSRLAPDTPREPLARADQDREVAALARALDDYQQRIERMVRREQEFTANASHELRTPLTGIKTSCELLAAEPDLNARTRTRIDMISGAADRMAEQIQALLFLAREQKPGALQSIDLATCVADAVATCRADIARKGVRLEIDVASNAVLQLDPRALHLVLTNLLGNALRHTDHGFIRIAYRAPRITVTDSGAGIAPEHLSRLFERFYRASDESEGLGLGLAIVRQVCDRIGWNIEVASTPGTGSTFTLTLT